MGEVIYDWTGLGRGEMSGTVQTHVTLQQKGATPALMYGLVALMVHDQVLKEKT